MPHCATTRHLRKGRYSAVAQIYMVTSVTKGRVPVFAEMQLGRLLVQEMKRCEEQGLVRSMAWVVMPDHLHWLFELKAGDLPSLMKQLKARSSIAVGKLCVRPHALWQSGYHDRAIRDEKDIAPIARYIVANPLRAGLVKKLGDYPLWDAIWV
ncbi:transposase [Pseudomonas syringae]|uniref:REP-associated tyrosine transposase n=1 Tax=Pseudomonas syringae TaxID=317 RepID=UPI00191785BB|nr:transposase [Pseudomonas syringae]QQQ50197.1 transposase [Pseudomonas syringae]